MRFRYDLERRALVWVGEDRTTETLAGFFRQIGRRRLILLKAHLDGILAWTPLRVSNGAVDGMNNKIKLVSHRSFGFRQAPNFIAAIYHTCAQLPLPAET